MLKENLGYNYQLRVNLQRAKGGQEDAYGDTGFDERANGNKHVRWTRRLPRLSFISRRNRVFLTIYFTISISALLYVFYVAAFSGTLKQRDQFRTKTLLRRVHQANETLLHKDLCIEWKCRNYDQERLLHRSLITVVTAYFNLGSFKKGDFNEYTTQTYWNWIRTYSKLLSNVVFYTDDYAFARRMFELRVRADQRTCVCFLDRDSLWSFSLIPRIKRIQSKRGYPRHSPNTIIPEYGAAMHAKYELMNTAVAENVFDTRFFAWSDIGVFRSLIDTQQFQRVRPFELALPPNFNMKQVAYTQVEQPDFQRSVDEYFSENLVWVCGCFFLAERDVMQRWTVEYRRFVELFLQIGWSSTDQQILYTMFNRLFAYSDERPRVQVQEYVPRDDSNAFRWFHLALLCRHQGLKLLELARRGNLRSNVPASRLPRPGINVVNSRNDRPIDDGRQNDNQVDTDLHNQEDHLEQSNADDQQSRDDNEDLSLGTQSLYFEY